MPNQQRNKKLKLSDLEESDERSMLGGRLDAEGYFAAKFTTKSTPTRSRNNKYVMTIYCLS